jgi:alkanesulfonate monooxygenase SsuD/methylene tetrahydromethanopterin reductase-like flavin-dependent oxidoreductase (luciferase family)
MSDLTFGLFVRGQYHAGDDMRKRFEEVKAQVRLADQLGFSDLLTGMHYAAAPLQQYQMIPLLARLLAETERMRIITGIILLSLHKPIDIEFVFSDILRFAIRNFWQLLRIRKYFQMKSL